MSRRGRSLEVYPDLPRRFWFEDARSAISRNDSPDIHFDYAMKPYRGCEHSWLPTSWPPCT